MAKCSSVKRDTVILVNVMQKHLYSNSLKLDIYLPISNQSINLQNRKAEERDFHHKKSFHVKTYFQSMLLQVLVTQIRKHDQKSSDQ